MTGPIARILLRVLVGFLVGKALLTPEDGNLISNDPDVAMIMELAVGGLVWAATEGWYWLAKKLGWAT